ncbi:hypothetical protein BJY52DRAFT_1420179 [Lactarius psammicola]|nr:hypothetical protein BJY52DRAFT_1420179 [Lactarius psammicola]
MAQGRPTVVNGELGTMVPTRSCRLSTFLFQILPAIADGSGVVTHRGFPVWTLAISSRSAGASPPAVATPSPSSTDQLLGALKIVLQVQAGNPGQLLLNARHSSQRSDGHHPTILGQHRRRVKISARRRSNAHSARRTMRDSDRGVALGAPSTVANNTPPSATVGQILEDAAHKESTRMLNVRHYVGIPFKLEVSLGRLPSLETHILTVPATSTGTGSRPSRLSGADTLSPSQPHICVVKAHY